MTFQLFSEIRVLRSSIRDEGLDSQSNFYCYVIKVNKNDRGFNVSSL